jgi:hypothetical protein
MRKARKIYPRKQVVNYEKLQYNEHRETNLILWINTIFTVLTGIATLVLALYGFFHH